MARKLILLLILLTIVAGYAHAIGVGGEGLRFGRVGATAGKATIPVSTGPALLVNGTSTALLIDNTNSACLAGGAC